jgi:hypothetical protein
MKLKPLKRSRALLIEGSAATVVIRKPVIESYEFGWIVGWEVFQRAVYEEVASGSRHFTDEELAAGFGISEKSGRLGDWIIERFGAEVAKQGTFIRWKEYLNIPCPGTGQDGDPNVSVFVDEEIKAAVCELLR